ncbi:MAG: hypothetical protein K2X87_25340, partial [Gemmataceae bacterium]|nr:hypothetical protein [Gemmataceae bacterium]
MPADRPADWPAGLARTWLTRYNRFAFLVLATRETSRRGWPAGCLRDLVTAAAEEVVAAADQLRALGYAPQAAFAGDERTLWEQTARYMAALPVRAAAAAAAADARPENLLEDLARAGAAWDRFRAFAAGLPDDAFAGLTALRPGAFRPDGLLALLGHRVPPPTAGQPVGQPLGEDPDEPAVLPAGRPRRAGRPDPG